MLKRVLLAVLSTIAFMVFTYQGFNWGTKSELITQWIPSIIQTPTIEIIVYLCICATMIFLGLAIFIVEAKNFTIDISKGDLIPMQVIKPLLIGYTFGAAYISLIQLLGVIFTL